MFAMVQQSSAHVCATQLVRHCLQLVLHNLRCQFEGLVWHTCKLYLQILAKLACVQLVAQLVCEADRPGLAELRQKGSQAGASSNGGGHCEML